MGTPADRPSAFRAVRVDWSEVLAATGEIGHVAAVDADDRGHPQKARSQDGPTLFGRTSAGVRSLTDQVVVLL